MADCYRILLTATVGLNLSACATDSYDPGPGSRASRQATSAAETACMTAINSQYGGKVGTVKVTGSEFPEANSQVIVATSLAGGKTERWRCLSSNDGTVQDLSMAQ